ncbi:MAG: LytTR family transcriptional regulator DNA-binding domain-containing protein [Cytophagales bacterium]|nr:LytTR family transcriptional regulator DNA-binding domain-containing protein [Cytophagales bacterium]
MWSIFYRHLGEPAPLIDLLRSPQYYIDLGFIAFAVAGLWKLNQAVIRRMDRQYSWAARPGRRLAVQGGLTVGGTLLLVLSLTFLYNRVARLQPEAYNLGYVLFTDLVAALLFTGVVHLLYTGVWMVTYHRRLTRTLQSKLDRLQRLAAGAATPGEEATVSPKTTLLVNHGKGFVPVETAQVAYITTANEVSIVRTLDGRSFTVDASLEQLSGQLSAGDFYRVSRQCIVNRAAIARVAGDEAGRLVLSLRPDPSQQTLVSRRRATEFNQWMGA